MDHKHILTDIVTGDIDMDALQEMIATMVMEEIKTEMQKRTPVDSGHMKAEWHERIVSRKHIEYSNTTPYLPFHITGTGLFGPKKQMICAKGMSKRNPKYPHVMMWVPRDAKGRKKGMVFRRCIKGMHANSFIEEGIDDGIKSAIDILSDVFTGADRVVT